MTDINVLRACWTLAPETAADEPDRTAMLSRRADDLAVLLDQVRADAIAAGYFHYCGPDELMRTLVAALNLPDQVLVIETRME